MRAETRSALAWVAFVAAVLLVTVVIPLAAYTSTEPVELRGQVVERFATEDALYVVLRTETGTVSARVNAATYSDCAVGRDIALSVPTNYVSESRVVR